MIFLVASNIKRAIGCLAFYLYSWNYWKLLCLNAQLKLNAKKKLRMVDVNLCEDSVMQCTDPV